MAGRVATSGRVFFEVPSVILMKGNADVINPVTDIVNGVNTGIRTRSMQMDYFNKDKVIPYGLSEDPTKDEIREYLQRNAIHGYGEGAIVARRHCHGMRFLYPAQWGMITTVYDLRGMSTKYHPYYIKWFDVTNDEGSWAEDLIVIHAALDKTLIVDIAEEQGMDVTIAKEWLNRKYAI